MTVEQLFTSAVNQTIQKGELQSISCTHLDILQGQVLSAVIKAAVKVSNVVVTIYITYDNNKLKLSDPFFINHQRGGLNVKTQT